MWAAPIWSSSSQVRSLKLLELAQIGTPPSKHPQQHSNATCSTAISHGLISGREAEWADDLSRSWYPLEWFGSTNYIYIYMVDVLAGGRVESLQACIPYKWDLAEPSRCGLAHWSVKGLKHLPKPQSLASTHVVTVSPSCVPNCRAKFQAGKRHANTLPSLAHPMPAQGTCC